MAYHEIARNLNVRHNMSIFCQPYPKKDASLSMNLFDEENRIKLVTQAPVSVSVLIKVLLLGEKDGLYMLVLLASPRWR